MMKNLIAKACISIFVLVIGCGTTPVTETPVQKKEDSVADVEKAAPPKTPATSKYDEPTAFDKGERGISFKPLSPSGTRVSGNQWLFVIGIDTYVDWPRLKTAVNDARSVRDILLSRYHFERDKLIELYDEQATRKSILNSLRFLAKSVRENDSLVIFYAGHGYLDPITKEGSWIPVESGTKDVSAWISNHDIKNYLRVDAIKAKHVLLISDSCFSGDFFRGHRGKLPEVTDAVIKKAYRLTSRQAITSGGLEPVSDEGFGKNSVFSHFFVKALHENQKPFLIPSDLFPYVKVGVTQNAEQFPRFGSLSGTGGQQGGELVLFLKQDERIEMLRSQTTSKQEEYERLKQMAAAADETRRKEAAEIARREAALAELDADIEAMRKRLGTTAVRTDDSLDAMLAMVRQKEEQEKKLEALRRQREEEERQRQDEIARLKWEQERKIIEMLRPEVEKYKLIVASKYGENFKSDAWNALIAKCPVGWADAVKKGDTEAILLSPYARAIEVWREPVTDMKFVWDSGGCYQMGCGSWTSDCYSDEKPVHEVCVDGFWLGKHEVTQSQWQRVMGNNPSHFKKVGNYPVEKVSWNDAKRFIDKLSTMNQDSYEFRLPTEAEWEYACRSGGRPEKYSGGSHVERVGWYDSNSGGSTHPVGTKNPNGLGRYDMSGNVWEWCEDIFSSDAYSKHMRNNPLYTDGGSDRVIRGGSWIIAPRYLRCGNRGGSAVSNRGPGLGFRLLRTE